MNDGRSPHFPTDSGATQEKRGSQITDQPTPEAAEAVSQAEPLLRNETPGIELSSSDPSDDDIDLARYADNSNILKSFDMIFQLHERSEEIRARLEKIDRILLRARTVAGLTRQIVQTLEKELELAAVRMLWRQGHPTALLLGWEPPPGVGIVPDSFFENEGLFHSEPFLLDNPSGPLAQSLFGIAAPIIGSAAVATLCIDQQEVGIICFGSDDPMRYCASMNTDLIASLANKISLGIQNAWDHERRAREALKGPVDGIFSNVFFREVVQREFDEAWRYGKAFSLMALSWKCHAAEGLHPPVEVLGLLRRNLRSCDLAAHDDCNTVWVLLPETDAAGARVVAQRLAGLVAESFFGDITFHAGLTQFSRTAPVVSRLVSKVRLALEEAMESVTSRIVVKTPPLPEAFPETSRRLSPSPA